MPAGPPNERGKSQLIKTNCRARGANLPSRNSTATHSAAAWVLAGPIRFSASTTASKVSSVEACRAL